MKIMFLLKSSNMHEPLGILLLSAILKKQGHEVALLIVEKLDQEKCIQAVKKFCPRILAYSTMTGEHNYYIKLNQLIRKTFDCLSVFGGAHPTIKPDMVAFENVDAVCRGEGDIYFPQLIEKIEQGQSYFDTPNFWFKDLDSQIIKNPVGPLVKNLDDLPFADRELIYEQDHAVKYKSNKMFSIMRGCPYKCTYCYNNALNELKKGNGRLIRWRSVDNILSEIKYVKKNFRMERVFINDDTFLFKPRPWLEEFAERFPSEIGLPLSGSIRANLLDREKVKLLKKMNCTNVYMGVECSNDFIANDVLKREVSNDTIVKTCELLHEYKIKFMTQNLIGLPVDDPLQTDLDTLDFNIKLKPHFGWSSILYPLPATVIKDIAVKKNLFSGDYDNIPISNKTTFTLDFGDEKLKRKIINLHKLFGVVVQFPFLRPFVQFLISLPLTKLYTWIFFAFYGLKMLNETKPKNLFTDFKYYALYYLKYMFQLEKRRIFKN